MAVVVGHIILISAQVKTRTRRAVLEAVTFGAFAEVQRGATGGDRGVPATRWQNYFALQEIRRENERLQHEVGAAAARSCSRSARWPSSRARCRSCSSSSRRRRSTTDRRGGHRRRRQPRLPDDDHRQGDRTGLQARHGRDRARRGRRPHHHAEPRARPRSSCSSTANAAAGGPRRAVAGPGRGGGQRATNRLRDGVRAGQRRHQGRGPRGDLRHRRDLPEGLR